jgi:hypothetical protein
MGVLGAAPDSRAMTRAARHVFWCAPTIVDTHVHLPHGSQAEPSQLRTSRSSDQRYPDNDEMGLGLAYPDYGVLGVTTDSDERSGKLEQRVVLWYPHSASLRCH